MPEQELDCYPCAGINMPGEIKVIEWPNDGAALRGGGWWVVIERKPGGYTPLAGPFKTRHRLANVPPERGAQAAYDYMVWGWL